MVPLRAVKLRTRESFEPRQVGNQGPIELADTAHQDLGVDLLSLDVSQCPAASLLIELCVRDLCPELDMGKDLVLLRAMIDVIEDLLLPGPLARPVRFLFEREAVCE